jgi:hypothetical protein
MADAAEARAMELEVLRSMYGEELCELDGGALEIDIPISLDEAGILVACGAQRARVRHLLLVLRVAAPADSYPFESAPDFAIASSWLDARAHARLLAELAGTWEAVREPILVAWVEQLRAEAAEGLAEIALDDVHSERQPSGDGLPLEGRLKAAFNALIAEDATREAASTGTQIVRCGICLSNLIHSDMVPFACCAHLFCGGCLKVSALYVCISGSAVFNRTICIYTHWDIVTHI